MYKKNDDIVYLDYYGCNDNINMLFEDLYKADCDIEKNAKLLYEYFMNKVYENESKRFRGRGKGTTNRERLFYLENRYRIDYLPKISTYGGIR